MSSVEILLTVFYCLHQIKSLIHHWLEEQFDTNKNIKDNIFQDFITCAESIR